MHRGREHAAHLGPRAHDVIAPIGEIGEGEIVGDAQFRAQPRLVDFGAREIFERLAGAAGGAQTRRQQA